MKNEYLEFKQLLNGIDGMNPKPKLLLHACCGPCSTSVIKLLQTYFDITLYYYNPNIYPVTEYQKREKELRKLVDILGDNIPIITEDYDYNEYLEEIKGYEHLGERTMRCYKCYEFRIKKLSEVASALGFDYYTTVMSVSPYKDSNWINELGKKYQLSSNFLYSNFKKENGYSESIRLAKIYDLYRQDYCGCEFSMAEHQEKINK